MLRLSLFLCAIFLLPFAPAAAQDATPPIERQMSAQEFKAAGLDKLTAAELASLNTWLKRAVATESGKAVAEVRREQEAGTRGFKTERSEAFEARLVGHFDGFKKGLDYTLDNGQVWQQVDATVMYGVKLDNPSVQLKPGAFGEIWYMRVGGRAVNAKVKRIK